MAIVRMLHISFGATYVPMQMFKKSLGEKDIAVVDDVHKYVCRVSNIVV